MQKQAEARRTRATKNIGKAPKYLRILPTELRTETEVEEKPRVDREDRIIRGYVVTSVGEAMGHGYWLDETFVNQIVDLGNKRDPGIKSRFTHPGLSADGLGKGLGRSKNFRPSEDGQHALADLHLYNVASETPDGDLAKYVMDLAEEDPDAFGASVVYFPDRKGEGQFRGENLDDDGKWQTPDERNKKNLRHARAKALRASDVVDEPATGSGFFLETEEMAAQAEGVLSFALGLTEEVPSERLLGAHPDRVKTFLSCFLARHGLELRAADSTEEEEEHMGEDTQPAVKPQESAPAVDPQQIREEALKAERGRCKAIREAAFSGQENLANKLIDEGTSLGEAVLELNKNWKVRQEELAKQEKLQGIVNNTPPHIGVAGSGHDKPKTKDFKVLAREYSQAHGVSLMDSFQILQEEDPEGYREWIRQSTANARKHDPRFGKEGTTK